MEFITGSSIIIPRSMILKHNAGENFLYLKAIRHEKLNRPDKPCEPSPEYKLASCLEKSVVARAGCQPIWKRFTTWYNRKGPFFSFLHFINFGTPNGPHVERHGHKLL